MNLDKLFAFLKQEIALFENHTFTVQQIALIILIWIAVVVVNRFVQKRAEAGKFVLGFKLSGNSVSLYNKVVQWTIFLLGFYLTLLSLGDDGEKILNLSINLGDNTSIGLSNIMLGILILVAARFFLLYAKRAFVRWGESQKIPIEAGRSMAIYQIFQYLVYVLAVIIALANLHVKLDVLVASSAGLFVGVGLALQQTFSDFAAGVVILFDGTVKVGDMVILKQLQLQGRVKEIRLRSSIIETQDSVSVVVPNSKLTMDPVVNWNFNDKETRLRLNVGVAYGSDVQKVRSVMEACAAEHGLILKNPPPRVRFKDFGNSSLDFELIFWINRSSAFEDILSDLRFMIDGEFRRSDIEIPFPQRDLHIRSDFRYQTDNEPESMEKK
ncbi:mechanosensitive ion channel domain-containing protein [Pontibacter sp. G13]|uniref:mechanosensitive ion channel family protein n=1 Tax=Pontibacter sp. G13 TaxID=3074898 RepID=UPI0028890890|nr:mechanosensitive ion channel domain-containing protein [Pontibacter sp. G13]WNJ16867.1 mechanosensitive ion channel [Pontibacter sp. G13]